MFIKKFENGLCIISVYINDINVIGAHKELTEASSCLKTEFEMKDLGKTKFCLGLQIEHFPRRNFSTPVNLCEKGFGKILYG